MKIVHCIWSLCPGGAELMLIELVNQQSLIEDVSVIIVNDVFSPQLVALFSPCVEVHFIHRPPGSHSLRYVWRLNRLLHKIQPTVVHLHNSNLAAIVRFRPNRGLFLTVHDLQISLKYVRRNMKLIAISDAVKEDVLNRRGSYCIKTIPNGIDVNAIMQRDPAREADKSHPFRIIQVARLEAEKKGQDILIEAIAFLKKKGLSDIHVDFIGEGSSMAQLQNLTAEYDVVDKVHFWGLRERAYIYQHLKDYDLMCHPARYEGFGLAVAEGMAAGLPVLVPDEGGPFEVIRHGALGYTFKMGDAEDCASMIEHIARNYDDALRKTAEAQKYVLEQFSIQRMAMAYIDYYKEA